jgi:hypothetical protein
MGKKSPREAVQAPASDAPKKETGFAAAYVEFARTLRTWFVAYGIGAPVLVLNQESLREDFVTDPSARRIAWSFLAGVALQIAAAITYKVAMWYQYMGELDDTFCTTKRYKLSEWVSTALWLELLFDAGTIALFAFATVSVVRIITG